jgi:UDP-N-acetylglucosamine 2-epimerase (non-hydrolysing)
MFEVLGHYRARIEASDVLERLDLAPGFFYVVSCHREENVDDPANLEAFAQTLNALAATRKRRIIFSTHPRTRKRIDELGIPLDPLVEMLRPLGFLDYIQLQLHAAAVLSDSGTITEESSILGLPALNLRQAHERPEGMEEGAVIMTGLGWTSVERGLEALEAVHGEARPAERASRLVRDYDAPNVSQTVLRTILSYTDYVNRTVWRKS